MHWAIFSYRASPETGRLRGTEKQRNLAPNIVAESGATTPHNADCTTPNKTPKLSQSAMKPATEVRFRCGKRFFFSS